jgi:hypothetical protein
MTVMPIKPEWPTITFPDGRPAPSVLGVEELSELFSIPASTIYAAIKRGEVYAKKFSSRCYKVTLADALGWFNAER